MWLAAEATALDSAPTPLHPGACLPDLTVIRLEQEDYQTCWICPADPAHAWPPFYGSDAAALLECEPEGEQRWVPTSEQRWPADVIRTASMLGLEPRLNQEGVPLVGAGILTALPEYDERASWHYLSLGFTTEQSTVQASAWAQCRAALLESLVPSRWPGPQGCDTILVVTEADYLVLLTRDSAGLRAWIAKLVRIGYDLAPADATEVAAWLMREPVSAGVCIESVTTHGKAIRILGHWGRAAEVSLAVGKPAGGRFAVDLPRSGAHAV